MVKTTVSLFIFFCVYIVHSAQPNDLCGDAINLNVGTEMLGNTIESLRDESYSCSFGFSDSGGNVWYQVSPSNTYLEVSTCFLQTDFNSTLMIFEDACGTLTCYFGNDDGCFEGGSKFTIFVQPGVDYLIAVSSENLAVEGNFKISAITVSGYPSYDCQNAIPLNTGPQPPVELPELQGLVYDPVTNGPASPVPNLFYQFNTGQNTVLDVSFCRFGGSLTVDPLAPNFQNQLFLALDTADCNTLTCISSNIPICNYPSELYTTVDPYTSYYLIFYTLNPLLVGQFNFWLDNPPENDICGFAQYIEVAQSVTTSFFGATRDGVACFGAPEPMQIILYEGIVCPGLACRAQNIDVYDGCSSGKITTTVLGETNYYLSVASTSYDFDSFTLYFDFLNVPPPLNSECLQAEAVAMDPYSPVSFSTVGAALGVWYSLDALNAASLVIVVAETDYPVEFYIYNDQTTCDAPNPTPLMVLTGTDRKSTRLNSSH